MKRVPKFRASLCTALILATLSVAGVCISRADKGDTPEDVMKAGTKANGNLKALEKVVQEAQALTARMARRI